MMDWMKVVRNWHPGSLFSKHGMLLLDTFKRHLTQDVKEEMRKVNADLIMIPGGMTSQLQVLRHGQQVFQIVSSAAAQRFVPKGEPCPYFM
jgi:hypothetical protein